jgi:hypothetical protein
MTPKSYSYDPREHEDYVEERSVPTEGKYMKPSADMLKMKARLDEMRSDLDTPQVNLRSDIGRRG